MKPKPYKRPNQPLHPKLREIFDAIPEEIQDEHTGRYYETANSATSLRLTPFKHAAIHWELRPRWASTRRAVRISYHLLFSGRKPRDRLFKIKDDDSFNLKGVIKALREIHAEIEQNRERVQARAEHKRREENRVARLLPRFACPEGWRVVYLHNEIHFQRDKVPGEDGYWRRTDSIQVDEDERVSGKLNIKGLSIDAFNKIIETLAEAEAESSE